jgi:lipopolysaccharide biosynthesis glycosyltransferase
MNVIYASDDGYAWLMGVSMVSLFENNRECKEINVYLFGDKIKPENEEKLYLAAKQYDRKLEIIDVNKLKLPEKLYSGRYPKSAFSRLFAFDLLPQNIDRVLYLDCDIIVDGNIEELYNQKMENKIIWALWRTS